MSCPPFCSPNSERVYHSSINMNSCPAVAYVKFQVASQAARALETLHLQTLKDGRVTVQLKVLYADPIDKVPNNENRCCSTLTGSPTPWRSLHPSLLQHVVLVSTRLLKLILCCRSDNAKMTDPDNHPPRSRLFLVVPRDTSPAPVEVCNHKPPLHTPKEP